MKKNWIYLLLFMAFAVMPLTSCDKDDDKETTEIYNHDPESDDDQIAMTGYDALEWLQGSIVVVDENNEVVRRIYGKPLDESQPTVISVPVEDLNDAKETFLCWVAPDKEATEVDGGYDYSLTDAEGKAQGSVSFRAVEGEAGVIARMSIADDTDLKQVSEVIFIDSDLWPENASVPVYQTDHTYFLNARVFEWRYSPYGPGGTYGCRSKDSIVEFYCIQGNMDSKEAILVWISPEAEKKHVAPRWYSSWEVCQYLPGVPEAERVLKYFNENKGKWDNMLDQMNEKGHLWKARWTWTSSATGNYEFMLNEHTENTVKCLDIDSRPGKICDVKFNPKESGYLDNHYRYMHIRVVPRKHW